MLCNIKQFVLFTRGRAKKTKRQQQQQQTTYCSKEKTSHSQQIQQQQQQQKRVIKKKCNAGQPQVPGRGRKVSRVGKLTMTLLGRGPLINFLFAVFKLKAPPWLSRSFKKVKSVFLKPTSLQNCFSENSWTNGRRLKLVYLNECLFSSFEINDMHVPNDFYRSWKATCFSELLLRIVHKDLTVYSQFLGLSWGIIKRALHWKPVSYSTLLVLLRGRHRVCDFRGPKIGTFCSCFYTQTS